MFKGKKKRSFHMKVLRYDDCLLVCDYCFCEGLCERESDHGLRSGFGSLRGSSKS